MGLSPEAKKTRSGCSIFLWVVVICFTVSFGAVAMCTGLFSPPDKIEKEPAYYTLKAIVDFNGSQFIVTNNDDFDWTDVQLEVNSGIIRSGYVFKMRRMNAGVTYTIGARRFAKGDGTRFNPLATKPQKFLIMCDTPQGKGFWTGDWKGTQ